MRAASSARACCNANSLCRPIPSIGQAHWNAEHPSSVGPDSRTRAGADPSDRHTVGRCPRGARYRGRRRGYVDRPSLAPHPGNSSPSSPAAGSSCRCLAPAESRATPKHRSARSRRQRDHERHRGHPRTPGADPRAALSAFWCLPPSASVPFGTFGPIRMTRAAVMLDGVVVTRGTTRGCFNKEPHDEPQRSGRVLQGRTRTTLLRSGSALGVPAAGPPLMASRVPHHSPPGARGRQGRRRAAPLPASRNLTPHGEPRPWPRCSSGAAQLPPGGRPAFSSSVASSEPARVFHQGSTSGRV